MMSIKSEIFADAKLISNLKKRPFNRMMKNALQSALKLWHKKILPIHFTQKAYQKYSEYYLRRKKRGDPMVKTGGLKAGVLARADISGTSNKAKVRMYYGRPGNLTKKQIRNKIFYRVKFKGEPFKVAERTVYRNIGGYGKNKELFNLRIGATDSEDIDMIKEEILRVAKNSYKPSGRKTRIKNV